jgi:hypothetical protein
MKEHNVETPESLDAVIESQNKLSEWSDEHNTETDERVTNGKEIAEIISSVEPSLTDTRDIKENAADSTAQDGERVVNEQVTDQDSITDVSNSFREDLSGKSQMEVDNINKIQSSISAFEAGGYNSEIYNQATNDINATKEQIDEYNNNAKEVNEKMIDTNQKAFDDLSNAIANIKI